MPKPKVTVYILNHNYGCYLKQAVDSVLSQTLKDVEILLIDDGSTDNSKEIIESYRHFPNVNIIYQKNSGLTISNNIAIRLAQGEYIMRLDADDYLDENALQVLCGYLDRNPSVSLVFPDYWLVDAEGNITEIVRRHDFSHVTMLDQPAHGACTMIRRELLLEMGGYDESFTRQDGYYLWLKMTESQSVNNINLPLFYYRQHGPSLSANETKLLEVRSDILNKFANQNKTISTAIGIIPIRGDNKAGEIPCMRMLAGRPLIDWTLEAALESTRLTHIIVTTPSEELLSYVKSKNNPRLIAHERSAELAMPNTPIESTVAEALNLYSRSYDRPGIISVIYVESPFRSGKVFDSAIDSMDVFAVDSLVTVRPEVDIFYKHNGHGMEEVRKNKGLRLEREELYREAGRIYVTRREAFEQSNKILSGRIGHSVVSERTAWRIRRESDWLITEFLATVFDNVPHLPATFFSMQEHSRK